MKSRAELAVISNIQAFREFNGKKKISGEWWILPSFKVSMQESLGGPILDLIIKSEATKSNKNKTKTLMPWQKSYLELQLRPSAVFQTCPFSTNFKRAQKFRWGLTGTSPRLNAESPSQKFWQNLWSPETPWVPCTHQIGWQIFCSFPFMGQFRQLEIQLSSYWFLKRDIEKFCMQGQALLSLEFHFRLRFSKWNRADC